MKNRTKQTVPLLLIALSLLLIGAGTVRGEAQLVLTKAINICMECIGIG
ncbi:CD1871A family CXXC motif-containing protein [uncultured Negativibacillus sp.]|nr:CD1871A family CXXC motif-containing protein [uncultured Negativibacillus sp.]